MTRARLRISTSARGILSMRQNVGPRSPRGVDLGKGDAGTVEVELRAEGVLRYGDPQEGLTREEDAFA